MKALALVAAERPDVHRDGVCGSVIDWGGARPAVSGDEWWVGVCGGIRVVAFRRTSRRGGTGVRIVAGRSVAVGPWALHPALGWRLTARSYASARSGRRDSKVAGPGLRIPT